MSKKEAGKPPPSPQSTCSFSRSQSSMSASESRSPSPQTSFSRSQSSANASHSSKSRKRSSGDSPHASSNNQNGYCQLDERLRSVLSHRLGLPLLCSLHGKDPSTLPEGLKQNEKPFEAHVTTALDGILKTSVDEWVKIGERRTERGLAVFLAEKINSLYNETKVHAKAEVTVDYFNEDQNKNAAKATQKNTSTARMDIILSPDEGLSRDPRPKHERTTPFALIEVGRHNSEWWAKLDQNLNYIDQLGKTQSVPRLSFDDPLLCVVMTLEGEGTGEFQLKLGVFLCVPRKDGEKCWMTFLWNLSTRDLKVASKAFGRLLQVTSNFADWRNSFSKDTSIYKYLSSNCCRLDNTILRSYDNRYRKTNRSPIVYMDSRCTSIVGGEVKTILKIPEDGTIDEQETNDNKFNRFFNQSKDHCLLVIEVPYKKGTHKATSATDFLPVIKQLQQLHALGYVHGDIRAFNTVFHEDAGGLIDFDFSGKPGTPYPKGYRRKLDDGDRIGSGDGGDHNTLQKWHDWRALLNLIFQIHRFQVPAEKVSSTEMKARLYDILHRGNSMESDWSQDDMKEFVDELMELMKDLEENYYTPKPGTSFQSMLKDATTSIQGTQVGATGSPPQKN